MWNEREAIICENRKIIVMSGFTLFVAMLFDFLPTVFYLNTTDSLPVGLYMKIPGKDYRRGDFIIYEPDEKTKTLMRQYGWDDGTHTFLKIVEGIAGDTYAVDETTLIFTVNDKYVGRVYVTDTAGHYLPQLRGKFTVEEGRILPIAYNSCSFDGRYMGTISINQIKSKVMPILTK